MKNRKAFAFFVAASLAVVPAVAAEGRFSGLMKAPEKQERFYLTPEAGIVQLSDFCDVVAGTGEVAAASENGITPDSFRPSFEGGCNDTGTGIGLSGGYRVFEWLDVEGGFRYADNFSIDGYALNNADSDFNRVPQGSESIIFFTGENANIKADFTGWSLGVRGSYPIWGKFTVLGKLGVHNTNVETSIFSEGTFNALENRYIHPNTGIPYTDRGLEDADGNTIYIRADIDEGEYRQGTDNEGNSEHANGAPVYVNSDGDRVSSSRDGFVRRVDVVETEGAYSETSDKDDTGVYFGVGAEVQFAENTAFRLEYTRYEGDVPADVFTGGLVISF